jgi:hypothetical protein
VLLHTALRVSELLSLDRSLYRGRHFYDVKRKGTHIYYGLADRHVADLIPNALAHAAELEATPAAAEEGN